MKRTSPIGWTILATFAGLNLLANAQTPKRDPALSKLDAFVGSWTFEWNTSASIFGPAVTITGTERYQWLPGGFFLRMERDAKGPAGDFSNLGLFEYDTELKQYIQRIFNLTNGWSGNFVGTVNGNAWTWSGSGEIAGTAFQQRCAWTLDAGGASRAMRCEVSTDSGKTWAITEQGQYKKAR